MSFLGPQGLSPLGLATHPAQLFSPPVMWTAPGLSYPRAFVPAVPSTEVLFLAHHMTSSFSQSRLSGASPDHSLQSRHSPCRTPVLPRSTRRYLKWLPVRLLTAAPCASPVRSGVRRALSKHRVSYRMLDGTMAVAESP